ncbi:MAG: DUF2889 domain-containing protein [Bacillota bacterium]
MKELFRRYILSSVKKLPDRRARVHTVLCDTFHEAHLELEVERDTSLILAASGEMTRTPYDELCTSTTAVLKRMVGLNAAFGSARALREALNGPNGCTRWEELSLHAVGAFMNGNFMLGYHEMPPDWKTREMMLSMMPPEFKNICNAWAHSDDPDFPVVIPMPYRAKEGFHRCVQSSVRLANNNSLSVEGYLSDSLHELKVEMDVELPSRQVTQIRGEFVRAPRGPRCLDSADTLQELVGQTAWVGQHKLIRQTVGSSRGCSRYEEVVNEIFRAVMEAHYPLAQILYSDDPRQGRHMLYGLLKDTCNAYTEFKTDTEWNPVTPGHKTGLTTFMSEK